MHVKPIQVAAIITTDWLKRRHAFLLTYCMTWYFNAHRFLHVGTFTYHALCRFKYNACLVAGCRGTINFCALLAICKCHVEGDTRRQCRLGIFTRHFNVCKTKSTISIKIHPAKQVGNNKNLPRLKQYQLFFIRQFALDVWHQLDKSASFFDVFGIKLKLITGLLRFC